MTDGGIFSFAGWDGVSLSFVRPGKSGDAGLGGALAPPGRLGGGTGMFAPTVAVPNCGNSGFRGGAAAGVLTEDPHGGIADPHANGLIGFLLGLGHEGVFLVFSV